MRIIPFIMLALGLGSAIWTWLNRSRKASQSNTPHFTPDFAAFQTTHTLPHNALTHHEWRIRLAAVQQLSPSTDNLSQLVDALHDTDHDVREAAAETLIIIGEASVEEMTNLLDERSQEVRVLAVKVLSEINTLQTTHALIHALEDSSSWVREPAAVALGSRRASEAVDALVDLFEDSSPQVKQAAVNALQKIATPEALAALQELD